MNFKDMLDKISQLSEAETKETEKGRVHKGDYGRHYDTDEEGDEKKAAKAAAPKRGRGRPKKVSQTGTAYDFSAFMTKIVVPKWNGPVTVHKKLAA